MAVEVFPRKQLFATVAVSAVLTGLVGSELACASVRRFWMARPVTAAFLTGGLLLAATVLVVDGEIRRRQRTRVSRVLETALTEMVRQLNSAMSGVRRALEQVGGQSTAISTVSTVRADLARILSNDESAFQFVSAIGDDFDSLSTTVTVWAPTLLPFDAETEALNAYAKAAFEIGRMARTIRAQQILVEVAERRGAELPDDLDWQREALDAFDRFVIHGETFSRCARLDLIWNLFDERAKDSPPRT